MHQFIFVTVDEAAKCCVGKRMRVCFLMMVKKGEARLISCGLSFDFVLEVKKKKKKKDFVTVGEAAKSCVCKRNATGFDDGLKKERLSG